MLTIQLFEEKDILQTSNNKVWSAYSGTSNYLIINYKIINYLIINYLIINYLIIIAKIVFLYAWFLFCYYPRSLYFFFPVCKHFFDFPFLFIRQVRGLRRVSGQVS